MKKEFRKVLFFEKKNKVSYEKNYFTFFIYFFVSKKKTCQSYASRFQSHMMWLV